MFKLTVVNGAARGTVYQLTDGDTIIGRADGSGITLASNRISKKHCVISVDSSGVNVKDAGSSNGTFVNGVLTKQKKLNPGDRLSVGEYVLELSRVEQMKAPALAPIANVIPLRGVAVQGLTGGGTSSGFGGPSAASVKLPPKSLPEKIKFYFETYILNFVYNINEKQEWRSMMAGMFGVMVIAAAVFSVYPTIDRVQTKLEGEAKERAMIIARQIVDRNSAFIFEHLDSKVDVAFAEHEKGVSSAYVVDMDGRVLAPARKLNQYPTDPNEASFSADARSIFYKFEKVEERSRIFGDLVGVAVPLRVFNAAEGKNKTVALGLVFYDQSQVLFDPGTIGLAYIQAVILSAIVGVILYFSLLRLTVRPLQYLNEEIDSVLKGNAASVTKKYKMEEISPLIDVVNAALQRLPSGSGQPGGAPEGSSSEELMNLAKYFAERMTGAGVMILTPEKRILQMNAYMEEITGIRAAAAVGDEISNVARDAAFNSIIDDLMSKAQMSSEGISEDFDFSGTNFKMECMGLGTPGMAKAFLIVANKSGG